MHAWKHWRNRPRSVDKWELEYGSTFIQIWEPAEQGHPYKWMVRERPKRNAYVGKDRTGDNVRATRGTSEDLDAAKEAAITLADALMASGGAPGRADGRDGRNISQ